MGPKPKQRLNPDIDDFVVNDDDSEFESSPEPKKASTKQKNSKSKAKAATKQATNGPALHNKAHASTAGSHEAPKYLSTPPKTGKLTEAERMDKALLDELIGESTDDGNETESEGYYTAGESQSEEYDSDTASEEELKPHKSRKITANSTPTRNSCRLTETSSTSTSIKTPTQPDSAAAIIKPKAISSPVRKDASPFQGYEPAEPGAQHAPNTPTGSAKFAAVSLDSSPPDKTITKPQAWFSPNKKPDYENSRNSVNDHGTASATPAAMPPMGSASHALYYRANSDIEDDDDAV